MAEQNEVTRPQVSGNRNERKLSHKLAQSKLDDDEEEDLSDEEFSDSDEEDFMDMLPPDVRQRVQKLKELHSEREKIMEQYQKERADLELKYERIYSPFYNKRRDVISGKLDGEIKEEAKLKNVDADLNEDDFDGPQLVGVPEFWVCAIGNNDSVADMITERDNECLMYLIDVTCNEHENGMGFTLKFHFQKNPFFENKVLTKSYEVPNLLLDDEPILKNVTGCKIKWKSQHCITFTEVRKKQRSKSGKNAGAIRTVIKKERNESFFHFFSPPEFPNIEEMTEETADAIEEAFDTDYDIAQAFRSQIIPKAVLWFTGEAMDVGGTLDEETWPGGSNASDTAK